MEGLSSFLVVLWGVEKEWREGGKGEGGEGREAKTCMRMRKFSPFTVKLVTCSTWGLKQGDCSVQEGIRSVRQRKSQ